MDFVLRARMTVLVISYEHVLAAIVETGGVLVKNAL